MAGGNRPAEKFLLTGGVFLSGKRMEEKKKISLNPDKEYVESLRETMRQNGGYCPCRLEMNEENKCICKEFREQIADPDFEGYCHCMLYYKSK